MVIEQGVVAKREGERERTDSLLSYWSYQLEQDDSAVKKTFHKSSMLRSPYKVLN